MEQVSSPFWKLSFYAFAALASSYSEICNVHILKLKINTSEGAPRRITYLDLNSAQKQKVNKRDDMQIDLENFYIYTCRYNNVTLFKRFLFSARDAMHINKLNKRTNFDARESKMKSSLLRIRYWSICVILIFKNISKTKRIECRFRC